MTMACYPADAPTATPKRTATLPRDCAKSFGPMPTAACSVRQTSSRVEKLKLDAGADSAQKTILCERIPYFCLRLRNASAGGWPV